MASTYSTDLAIELMTTGENSGTWGTKTNTNWQLIEQAVAGVQSISIAGGAATTNLVMTNAALSNARNIVLVFTGAITGNQIVTIPNTIQKYYVLYNNTSGAFTVTFTTVSGTGITLTQGKYCLAYSDGTNVYQSDLSNLSGTIASGSIAAGAVTSTAIATGAVTSTAIATGAVTSTAIATGAVTSTAIATGAVTSTAIATGAVGTTQLATTGVTAASYTVASITVGADGRITAASSGSGGGSLVPTRVVSGPASGTHTANPAATKLSVFLAAGGGGGGTGCTYPGGSGGNGGYGFFNVPISQPFSQPYSIGGGGNAGPQYNPGSAGGNTNLTNVGTVNAGNGGGGNRNSGSSPGNPGNAPGANITSSTILSYNFLNSNTYSLRGGGFQNGGMCNPQIGAGSGAPGALIIYENIG